MWFSFGFVALIGAFIVSFYRKKRSHFKANKASLLEQEYLSRIVHDKEKAKKFFVGIETDLSNEFFFKKETKWDKFFKKISLSKEFQIGNATFDNEIYINSDDIQFYDFLKNHSKFTQAVIEIFTTAKKHYCKIKSLELRHGRLWIEYKPQSDFTQSDANALIAVVLPHLTTMLKTLKSVPEHKINYWKDSRTFSAVIILSISTALSIAAVINLIHLWAWTFPFTIDKQQLFNDALLHGTFLTISLIILTIILLKQSSKFHLVFLELITIGYFGSVGTMYSLQRDYNIEVDNSANTFMKAKVVSKRVSHSRKNGSSYYISLNNSSFSTNPLEIHVHRSFYRSTSIKEILTLKVHEGALSYRWVESIKLDDVVSF